MGTERIGLKLADGKFYPVLADGAAARKRLVLTTVQDGQKSVQIDLYRGSSPLAESSGYIGSLVIEGIPAMAKGEPDIRMEIGLGADETLTAFAEEASTGASQSLEVSLRNLSDEEKYDIPDFKFAGGSAPPSFSDEDFADTDELPADQERLLARDEDVDQAIAEEKRKRRPLVIALAACIGLALVLGCAYLVYLLAFAPGTAPIAAPPPPAVPAPVAAPPVPPAPEPAPAPAAAAQPAPVASPPAAPPAAAAPEPKAAGVWHKIKWGDTLWDISYAYYRNPWYYRRISTANKIKNPDLIISGEKIWIPKL